MSNNTVIKINNLTKTYKLGLVDVQALKGISFEIKAGEFVSIMGPSGCGKSTLMNLLGCLDQPTSGELFLDGINTSHLDDDKLADIRNKKIGFVFQMFNLLPRLTAVENVELPMVYAGKTTQERREVALQTLAQVGLEKRANHNPREISGGEMQRVAIARALVNKPALLLADEPTGNLDSKSSVEIMRILQRLNDTGVTIILVTHEPDIATFTKRKLLLRDGLLQEDQSIKQVIIG